MQYAAKLHANLRCILIPTWGTALAWVAVQCTTAETPSPDTAISKSGAQIPYAAIRPDDLGPKTITYDTSGMRRPSPAPLPGVHPRMLHSPEDRAELRRTYAETPHGRQIWRMLQGWTDKLKGAIAERSDYPVHSEGTMMAPYNRGGWTETAEQYRRILAGEMAGYTVDMNDYVLGCMALEAYRCWIENDRDGGSKLCKAIENIADHLDGQVKPGDHPGVIGAFNMGFCYDYAFNFMTEAQREKVRRLIAIVSLNKAHYGTFTEADSTTSNWCTLDSFMPLTLMAIEGEKGFNADYYRGFVRAYHNFITYGWYASGCPYEGLGKNYQFNTTMILLAKRGVDLIGHPHVRAYATRFLPGVSLPNGNGFIGCDDWGGTGTDTVLGNFRFNVCDVVGLKWLFPEDSAVDYVWRVYMGDNYERYTDFRPAGYYNSALTAAMFPSAPMEGPFEFARTGCPLTFFCPERGYMLTRSSSDPDALMLSLHCRQDRGGHTSADRNHFTFSALGRLWGHQLTLAGGSKFGKVNESRFFSTVLIDDVGQCGMASGCFPVPGKVVAYRDEELLTSVCGDAKYAYDWEWKWSSGEPTVDSPFLAQGWSKVEKTPNDFQFTRQPCAYMNAPFYEHHHWLQPGMVEHYVKKPWNPVKRAFRTATLVRGTHPYVLIVDDIEAADGAPHQYKWLMQASKDLEIYQFDFNETSDVCDMLLCGREVARDENDERRPEPGDPMLLVRVLQCNNDMRQRRYTPIGRLEHYLANIRYPKTYGKRLVIPSYGTSPDYKIMLYPYRYGEDLPETTWVSKECRQLRVAWGDQRDTIRFTPDDTDRTHVQVQRHAKEDAPEAGGEAVRGSARVEAATIHQG